MDTPEHDGEEAHLSVLKIQIKFDGPELKAHEMDVTVLGPSLFAFGELCQESNLILNGTRAKVRVLISANVQSGSVVIDLHVYQQFWDQIVSLINRPAISDAKTILEWIGLTGYPAFSLIKYLLLRKGRKETVIETKIENNQNVVIIQIEGDNNTVTIPKPVYELSKNSKIVESLKETVAPVKIENGIDEAKFIIDKKEGLKVDQEMSSELQKVYADDGTVDPQIITAHAVVHSPVLDSKAKQWKFKLSNHVVPIDISETSIARDVLERGEIFVGDTYKLKLEMTERKKPNGAYITEYKAKEVLEFIQGSSAHPTELPFTPPSSTPDTSEPSQKPT